LIMSVAPAIDTAFFVGPDGFSRTAQGVWVLNAAGAGSVAAVISNGTALSAAIDLGLVGRLARIITPIGWDAASLTFRTSYDGVAFADLFDETGTEVSYTLIAGKNMRVPFADWLGVRWLQIRSGTSAAPVNQSADRSFTLVTA